ncbi:MAG: LamG domain-containing protein [Planctomycetes bacterium]|nr:LamG domain-containing protein [Planctomycetota bacterium]MCB9911072.1 LamG domain-containing protein [Planctomycetota bacterium]MCB9912174.1 LamG domain-containing protein [Planctomycetota bacterium]HPF13096.1 LamG domain-containing protein [Planctomycetota bacterium]
MVSPLIRICLLATATWALLSAWNPVPSTQSESGEAAVPEALERVKDGIVVEYRFDEATGTQIHDRSGQTPALDLVVENGTAVRWISGGLSIQSPTLLNTLGPARRLTETIRRTGAISLEAWVRQTGEQAAKPAHLIGVSKGNRMRNFTLAQGLGQGAGGAGFQVNLRTTDSNLNGDPGIASSEAGPTGAVQHVVYTRTSAGTTCLYVDGERVAEATLPGTLENWDSSYSLAVANEVGATRPWLGDLFLIAVYDRALSPQEILQNFAVGSGDSNEGHLAVEPIEATSIYLTKDTGELRAERGWVIRNIGSKPLRWSASEAADWLGIEPHEGSLAPGQQEPLELRLDRSLLDTMPVGTYELPVAFSNVDGSLGTCERRVVLRIQPSGTSGFGIKPGPHNTGPLDSTLLEDVGSMTITKAGTRIENVRIRGALTIQADDVTVRNFVIDATNEPYGIRCSFGNTGIVLEDGEIYNMSSAGVFGGGFTARRLNLHDSGGDGFKTSSGSTVEGCWVHHLGTLPGAHADCNQTRDGQGFVFRGNCFDLPIDIGAPYKSNACLIVQTGLGPIDDVLIEGNWLSGGNYTIYITDKGNGYGPPTNVRLIGNRFGREYRYGVLTNSGQVHLEGNRWDDTGELMSINNH